MRGNTEYAGSLARGDKLSAQKLDFLAIRLILQHIALAGFAAEGQFAVIEVFLQGGFDDLKIGRQVEISRGKQGMVADVHDFLARIGGFCRGAARGKGYFGQNWVID